MRFLTNGKITRVKTKAALWGKWPTCLLGRWTTLYVSLFQTQLRLFATSSPRLFRTRKDMSRPQLLLIRRNTIWASRRRGYGLTAVSCSIHIVCTWSLDKMALKSAIQKPKVKLRYVDDVIGKVNVEWIISMPTQQPAPEYTFYHGNGIKQKSATPQIVNK